MPCLFRFRFARCRRSSKRGLDAIGSALLRRRSTLDSIGSATLNHDDDDDEDDEWKKRSSLDSIDNSNSRFGLFGNSDSSNEYLHLKLMVQESRTPTGDDADNRADADAGDVELERRRLDAIGDSLLKKRHIDDE